MPFTLSNIKEDLEDGTGVDGARDVESRAATKALELAQSALSYHRPSAAPTEGRTEVART